MTTTVGTGVSHHRNPRVAAQEAVREALATSGIITPSFVFVFATVGYNQHTLIKAVREAAGGAPLSGCSGAGVIIGAEPNESNFAVAIMAFHSNEITFRHGLITGMKESEYAGAKVAQSINPVDDDARSLFLFPDGLTASMDRFLHSLEINLPVKRHLPIFGGAAGDNLEYERTYQYCDAEVTSDGVAWALMSGEVKVASSCGHGCVPIGIDHTLTRVEGQTVLEIDHRPALEVFHEYLTVEDMTSWLTVISSLPFGFRSLNGVDQYDRYEVYLPMSQDIHKGSVSLPICVDEGTVVRLMRRDYEKHLTSVDLLAEHLNRQLAGQKPHAIFHFECSARGRSFLRDEPKLRMLRRLHEQLPEAPRVGFYSYGELAPVNDHNIFHHFTGVITALF
ncbi:FIST N-terminal domain-containing protein [Streptomyces sp. NPDC126514]|uniref:FIST signal transduction protein n=1 Tax=Streptomyces sp. NPDC126514 TaxID=3155210 RepID=UPI00331C0EA8